MTIIKHKDHNCDDTSVHDASHCYLNAYNYFERILEFPNAPHDFDKVVVLTAEWLPSQGVYELKSNGMHKGWDETAHGAWLWVNS